MGARSRARAPIVAARGHRFSEPRARAPRAGARARRGLAVRHACPRFCRGQQPRPCLRGHPLAGAAGVRAGAAVRLASPSTAGPHGAVRSRTRTCTYVFGCRRACVGVCGHVPACPWVSRARASVRRSASLYGSLRASAGRLGREERWVPHLGVTCAGPSGCAPASRPLPGKAGTSRGNPEPLYGTSRRGRPRAWRHGLGARWPERAFPGSIFQPSPRPSRRREGEATSGAAR